jgi:uncharacterized protein YndB with AHSA1/START domain
MSEASDRTTAERQITIRATPERVFQAFSEPEHLLNWFCDGIDTSDGRFRFWGKGLLGTVSPEEANQRIVRIEKARSLEIDWPHSEG